MNNAIETPKVGFSGKVLSWEVINADGSIDQSCYNPSNNVITDVGLDMIATKSNNLIDKAAYFCIGTGTAEPSATDTKLTTETYRAACAYASYDATTYSAGGSDPYYIYVQRGVQTPLGALNNTYGEIGFSPTATANANVFSKHRLKDENGDPTTITVSSAQQLRLKYVLVFCLSPSTVTTGTINISGIGNINYEAKWQYGEIHFINQMFNGTSFVKPTTDINNYTFTDIGVQNSPYTPYSTYVASATTYGTYVSGSHERFTTGFWSVDKSNVTWYGVFLDNSSSSYSTYPLFLVKFATPFVKDNLHSMRFTFKISWGRS